MIRRGLAIVGVILLIGGYGCTRHEIKSESKVEVAPIKVEPIHITIDLNIKIDKELDDFFSDLDEEAAETQVDE
ncbi:MAG: hypothetical protein LJE94_10430 [Deltaproteobacteria bacterium]|jgi:hypothetical protein|nr:hypothetical protein [Deltaproteobacteria bacterium]